MKLIQIQLNEFDFNQTIDGLEQRAIAWEKTARYHQTGEAPSDIFVEQCRDAREAKQIATHYRSIIHKFHQAVGKDAKSKSICSAV
jgi:predicted helicase